MKISSINVTDQCKCINFYIFLPIHSQHLYLPFAVFYRLHLYEPAGAILTTSEDIAKYIRFNLYGGTTESGKTLLSPVLFEQGMIGRK